MGRNRDHGEASDGIRRTGDVALDLLCAVIRQAIKDTRRDGALAIEAAQFLDYIGLGNWERYVDNGSGVRQIRT